MTDIVERLRSPDTACTVRLDLIEGGRLLDEAADEIERLRARIEDISERIRQAYPLTKAVRAELKGFREKRDELREWYLKWEGREPPEDGD
jgi:uncharacterized coiled-coil DUF342 family protein